MVETVKVPKHQFPRPSRARRGGQRASSRGSVDLLHDQAIDCYSRRYFDQNDRTSRR